MEKAAALGVILEHIPIGLAVNHMDSGEVLFVNRRFSEIYGWPVSELLHVESFFEKVYPDPEYREQIKSRILADIQSGQPERMAWDNIPISTQSGQKKIVSARNIPLDQQRLMISTVWDNTKDNLKLTTLFQERNLLRTLIDIIPDYIFIKDREGKFVVNNAANIKLLGDQIEDDSLGKTVFNYFPRELAQQYMEDDLLIMDQANSIWNKEEKIFDAKGHEKWISTTKVPLFNSENTIVGLVGISRDITDEKIREFNLKYRSKLLSAITAISHQLFSNEDWQIVLPYCLEKIGETIRADRVYYFENFQKPEAPEKLFSRQISEWTNGKVSPQINNQSYQNLELEKYPDFLSLALSKKAFSCLTKELSGATKQIFEEQDILSFIEIPIFLNDQFYGFIGCDSCIEERIWTAEEIDFLLTIGSSLSIVIQRKNNLDELLTVNKQLKKTIIDLSFSNQELEQFAYVASHDLQEPLRMISSFLTLIEKKYNNQLDEKGRQYIHYAVDGSKRMKTIIMDLLEYSRAGRLEYPKEMVNLNVLIEEISGLFAKIINDTQAEIIHDELPTLQIQKPAIRQVFFNLIGNSLKYKKENLPPKIQIKALDREREWEFIVSDNGIGIAKEYHSRVFNLFQRLHHREEIEGSGLGLSLCKKIIENQGGEIWLVSETDVGTQVHFTLPK